ncbi:Zinc finger family protein [Oxytricha trifallax]|uniref:Zinc finger family protein n=1 Tax=Oxytricha trifallax TaxID=1172189 RepID=A0A073HYZ3_9SPIT|nr:Zinc finger family protein [Oxytricha trifallax]
MPNRDVLAECNQCKKTMRNDKKKKHVCPQTENPTFTKLDRILQVPIVKADHNKDFHVCICGYKTKRKDKLKKHVCRHEQQCLICLNDMSKKTIIKSDCSHLQCAQCFNDWQLQKQSTCPFCRQEILKYTIHQQNKKPTEVKITKRRRQQIPDNYLGPHDAPN